QRHVTAPVGKGPVLLAQDQQIQSLRLLVLICDRHTLEPPTGHHTRRSSRWQQLPVSTTGDRPDLGPAAGKREWHSAKIRMRLQRAKSKESRCQRTSLSS